MNSAGLQGQRSESIPYPPAARQEVPQLRLQAWIAALLIFAMVYSIPPIGSISVPIPVIGSLVSSSPVFLLTGLFVLLTLPNLSRHLAALWALPELRWLTVLYVVLGLGMAVNADLRGAARLVMGYAVLLTLAAYMVTSPRHLRWVVSSLLVALLISHLWFALEMSVGDPFTSWRQTLYAKLYASRPDYYVQAIRTGLVPARHLLGYQSCVAVVLLFAGGLTLPSRWKRILIWTALSSVIVTMLISLQRSAALASLVGALLLLRRQWLQRRRVGSLLVVGVVVLLSLPFYQLDWLRPFGGISLEEKLLSDAALGDVSFRLRWQLRALELIVQNPFGLRVSGVSWAEAGFWHAYYQFPDLPLLGSTVKSQSVHNGYLNYSLEYGVVFLLGVLAFLYCLTRTCLRLLRWGYRTGVLPAYLVNAIPAAALGLFFPQAMLHNASILTRDPPSVIIFASLLALEVARRGEQKAADVAEARESTRAVRAARWQSKV